MKITKVEGSKKPFKPQNVEIQDVLVEDLITAERVSGKSSGFQFLAAVAAAACIFDGKREPAEEVQRMEMDDFLELTDACGLNGRSTSQSESSTLSEKESGEKNE